jgi:hypothetical protein
MTKARIAVLAGAAVVIGLLILYPDWVAIHPNDSALTNPAGYAWLTSPPAGFELMHVQKGTEWIWFSCAVAVLAGFFYFMLDQ